MGKWISSQQLRLALSRVVKVSDNPKLQFNAGTGSIADLAVPPNYMVGITNGAVTNGSAVFTDDTATNYPARYYRLRVP